MRIHLKALEANGTHTKFIVFMNGANCGQLTMSEKEAAFFHNTVMYSGWSKKGEVMSSGNWEKGEHK